MYNKKYITEIHHNGNGYDDFEWVILEATYLDRVEIARVKTYDAAQAVMFLLSHPFDVVNLNLSVGG